VTNVLRTSAASNGQRRPALRGPSRVNKLQSSFGAPGSNKCSDSGTNGGHVGSKNGALLSADEERFGESRQKSDCCRAIILLAEQQAPDRDFGIIAP
jgi:hypothetical protein